MRRILLIISLVVNPIPAEAKGSDIPKCPPALVKGPVVHPLPDQLVVSELTSRNPVEPRFDVETTYYRRRIFPGVREMVIDIGMASGYSEAGLDRVKKEYATHEITPLAADHTRFSRIIAFPDVEVSFGEVRLHPGDLLTPLFRTPGIPDRIRFRISRRGMNSLSCAMIGVKKIRKWRRILRRSGKTRAEINQILGGPLMFVVSDLRQFYPLSDAFGDVCEHRVPLEFDLEDESSPLWAILWEAIEDQNTKCDLSRVSPEVTQEGWEKLIPSLEKNAELLSIPEKMSEGPVVESLLKRGER